MFTEQDYFQQKRLSSRWFQSCSYIVFFCLSLAFSSISQLKRFPSVESRERHRERIVGWVGKYSILSIQFSRKMTQPPSRPPALSAKYYRWNSNADVRGVRRKRISSISQRVAVTVSVMAFGSVVESYSCANPIRALLRVYFRTRVACVYVLVVIMSCTHAFTER